MPSPVEEDAKHIRPCVPGCLCKRSLGSSKLLLWHILCIVLLPFWHILFIVLLPLSSKVQMITWCALLGPGNSFHTCCNLTCNSTSVVKNHTHACTHARTHARMHACTHARTHARTHTHTPDPQPVCLAADRSVTPTELERRRHLSSTGSLDLDVFDPLVQCQEIPMPA